MTKAYWIGHVTVSDPDAYQDYRRANAAAFAKYGGRFLVRGGAQEVVEGELRPRSVVIEFPDLAAARACYFSPEYQAALAIRAPVSFADMCIIEGWADEAT
ncbi:MAG: DUF1330 domain-containing protein [Paracoccus sp. (in: a-proteobacteria)]|uniref:DUF1330 domain-containing protein n=1 Tax=Paracoccus sp. TaxID=267 RepID=UPI0026E04829|nr:DUF1330 domain-containing protein [Paracoccus sp. (in: a-proteobacteria)]MDO5622214.1 DUF1330 domain-containing protein [Paracoccus sp. (in: a-proteobacteria)]